MNAYRDEDDDEDWEDDSDEETTVSCPYCRRDILEDSPRCPYCERYISEEDHASSQKPLWVIVTALACLAAALWWMLALPG
ncbi:MAG: hypothetical protein WCC69_09235 [Pirellulales bacterium]